MDERDQDRLLKLERLRNALAEGEASGSAREFDFDAFMKKIDEDADANPSS